MGREWMKGRQKWVVRDDCFPKLQLLAGLPKALAHTLLIHFKETPQSVSTSLEEKVFKKSTVKYLNLECDNMGLE